MRRSTAILVALLLVWQQSRPLGSCTASDPGPADLFHTVFPVECKFDYLLWQTVGLWHSFRKVQMGGSFTRLLSCAEDRRQAYIDAGAMDICPTFVTPSFTNYHEGDSYGPYNMAGTVLHWVKHAEIKERYILILDSDMVMLRPLLPSHLGISPGRAVAAFYGYLKGVANDLAARHIPEIPPREDILAGPKGRRSDQVGGVQSMTLEDLKRVAPLWLKYTEEVREDPLAWRDSGDVYVREGGKPWISEMYGYSFGCAKAGVWHTANYTMMLYPEYKPTGFPDIMHYGILFNIGDYQFDKHWFTNFDILKCPSVTEPFPNLNHPTSGLLPPPPRPSALPPATAPLERLRHLYAAATVALLNEAFCEFHMQRCRHTVELIQTCAQASQLAEEILTETFKWEASIPTFTECVDEEAACVDWAKKGECTGNPGFMLNNCRMSCGSCTYREREDHRPATAQHREGADEVLPGEEQASRSSVGTEANEENAGKDSREETPDRERVMEALQLGDFPLPRESNDVEVLGAQEDAVVMEQLSERSDKAVDSGMDAGFLVWVLPLVWITGLVVLASSCRSSRPSRRRRAATLRLPNV